MSEISANELEKKLYIEVDGQPYFVLDVKFATPSARGASTMVKARVRNLLNGSVQDKTTWPTKNSCSPRKNSASKDFISRRTRKCWH
ncbi:MAG: hypothetical protein HY767_03415 [Candidatus Omnitrophica bacterium]|nr:hypothetical protein [Candidatus Omnitrophota bacterium]